MASRITFQFDDSLDYQVQAVRSTVELFRGLSRSIDGLYRTNRIRRTGEGDPVRNHGVVSGRRLLENLRGVQLENELFADTTLYGNNFTIEMETGTGKTYVYLRTILELYKEYDFKKFIIVVPSIAIRKGVEKSIEQLKEHFIRLYNNDIQKHCFIYDSNNARQVYTKLVESNELSICVMNIQAFNKDTNRIRIEDEYGQILWEDIKYIKPIVIIDEPQKIEGTANKKSKSLQAIEDLEPLFTLRYSATHKKLYNQIYKLDSYGAYQKELVKKIEVKTVHGVIPKDFPYIRYLSFSTSDLRAKIEIFSQAQGDSIRFKSFNVSSGTSIYELSGGLSQYEDMRIAEQPHKLKPLQVATKDRIISLEMGHSNYEIQKNEAVRIQIRLAIQNHFAKQINLLKNDKKIKALTLFFIDSVDKVRDPNADDGRGEYLRIFDEEYQKYVNANSRRLEKYKEYYPEYLDVLKVREGYFAIDKKNNAVDVEGWDSSLDDEDVKLKAKSQEDIDRGIELILEKKDELISFEEPLAFIFSHSALREGWDNPNVFTLCTLKAGGTEIAKKQEIGRGLRLPVDISGNRCLDKKLNELTVIANDYYEHFANALQTDFNNNMNFNKNEVTAEILISALKTAGVPKRKITAELVDTFKEELISAGVMNANNVLKGSTDQVTSAFQNLVFVNETLNEHAETIKKQFVELMVQKGSKKIDVRNGDNEPYDNKVRAFVTEGEFEQVYMALRKNLVQRTMYKFTIDKDKFIEDCAFDINQRLLFKDSKNQYKVETGHATYNESARMEMKKADYADKEMAVDAEVVPKSDFEIANYIMYHTMLPRLAIFKIIAGVEKRDLLNNQDILDEMTQLILNKLNDTKAANITSYEVINGYELDSRRVFELDTISEEDFDKEWRVFQANSDRKAAVNEYYKMDSVGEYEFAKRLENNENILMFTKLKKGGFVIDTPYGNYSPDWAIVCKKDGLVNPDLGIYFIVETKAGKDEANLQDVERNKIRCGKLHFKAVSDQIKFDWVKSYYDFITKFGVKDSEPITTELHSRPDSTGAMLDYAERINQ